MGTQRLYYTDSYLRDFDARVVRTEADGHTVHFDRTAFYPASGGQPNDRRWCNDVEVMDVIDEGDSIAHHLAAPVAAGPVHCTLDWERRYDHMQQHTGQHLLSAVFAELFGFETLSFFIDLLAAKHGKPIDLCSSEKARPDQTLRGNEEPLQDRHR
jgi:alanyl-tRNA synthetase